MSLANPGGEGVMQETLVGPYRLGSLLASGTDASVCAAVHVGQPALEVAVKVLHPSLATRRFVGELQPGRLPGVRPAQCGVELVVDGAGARVEVGEGCAGVVAAELPSDGVEVESAQVQVHPSGPPCGAQHR